MLAAPPDSPEDDIQHVEQTAAEAREQVVTDDANRTWHGVQLRPWSEERQCLLDTLCAADVPMPDATVCTDVTWYHGMFPWAQKALYLAHHEPGDWERLRPRLLSVITQWCFADYDDTRANVPGDDFADKAAAVNFVCEMVGAFKQVRAQRRVKRSGASTDSGN